MYGLKNYPVVLIVLFSLLNPPTSVAQTSDFLRWNVGLELDALPYVTGGYFAAGWVGKDKWRCRLLTADVNKPDWFTTNGFRNHHIRAYALVLDRFLNTGWKGWWMGGGPVYWKSDIQTDALLQKASFGNFLINGSIGYHVMVYKQVYISPWAGVSLKIAGDRNITIDDKVYNLPLLNPEMSIKAGIFF